MNVKAVLKCVAVYLVGALLVAGVASPQSSAVFKVSDAIEAPANQFTGAVSAARCGSNIVVGFGDGEPGINSSAGYAVSRNNGATFSDRGVLPVSSDDSSGFGPDALGFDVGIDAPDNGERPAANTPSIACVNSSLFYYASVYYATGNADFNACFGNPECAAISLSTSKDGGVTWGLPAPVAAQSGDIHDLIFPQISVDPSEPRNLYVAYVNVNYGGPQDGFDPCIPPIYELWMATSADAGTTWANHLVDYACPTMGVDATHNGEVGWPSLTISPDGKVFVAYTFLPQGKTGQLNQIRFARSLDHGQTFSAPLNVSAALGNIAPKIAVDRTHSPHRGQIFLTWSGQPNGTYTSVLESDSLNGGDSFSFPRPVNGTPGAGLGRFQANPVVAVDNDGQVQVCYYNTPTNTPTSSSVYSYNCATSNNHGATWPLQRVSDAAVVGYDAVTSDFLTHHDGFFTAFELQDKTGQRHVAGQFSDID